MRITLNSFVALFQKRHSLDLDWSETKDGITISSWSNEEGYSVTYSRIGNRFTEVDIYTPKGVVWLDNEGQII